MPLKRTPEEILGVQNGANEEEIRRAYRSLAKQYHPDRNKEPDAAEKFLEIQKAAEEIGSRSNLTNFNIDDFNINNFDLVKEGDPVVVARIGNFVMYETTYTFEPKKPKLKG